MYFAEWHYSECRYAECHYAECHCAKRCYAECRGDIDSSREKCFLKLFFYFLFLTNNGRTWIVNPSTIFLYIPIAMEYKRGKYHCTVDLLFDRFVASCMTTDNFCFYLQNRLIHPNQSNRRSTVQ